ncbi:MAG: exodeoxyribonuclease VII large subunit, partial [Candidatus Acidiferrum sp.]
FEPGRRKPLPRFPMRVAIVTSPSGSAVRDMLEILKQRWPSLEVWLFPVRVQGDEAAREIAATLDMVNKLNTEDAPIDVVILGRGGGSLEDLWTFNEEVVAHAIFRSRIPIVTGVGHEDDVTIADLVADLRAATPTDAATKVVPDGAKLLEWLADQDGRLRGYLLNAVRQGRDRLADLRNRRWFREPLERIRDEERRLDEWNERLLRLTKDQLNKRDLRLTALSARLEALSPLNVLSRGYSLTRTEDGTVVRSPEQVSPDQRVFIQLQRGQLAARVERMESQP